MTDLGKQQAELFNSFFEKQCSLINKISEPPSDDKEPLGTVNLLICKIDNIIRGLYLNKTHGNVRIVFTCSKFVVTQFVSY